MDQALAIAYRIQREHRANGGGIGFGSHMMRGPRVHTGPINGMTGGRADARKMEVPAGAYVIPAAVVSHMGDGNTLAGQRVLGEMFKGPYGMPLSKPSMGSRMRSSRGFADGGATQAVPIYAADGEYVIAPEQVETIGAGDLDRGHAILDDWVRIELNNAARAIKNLPGPRKG